MNTPIDDALESKHSMLFCNLLFHSFVCVCVFAVVFGIELILAVDSILYGMPLQDALERHARETDNDHICRLEYYQSLVSLIKTITDRVYSYGKRSVMGREPPYVTPEELFDFGFEPLLNQQPCQGGEGVCVAEEILGVRPRLYAGERCKFCYFFMVQQMFLQNKFMDVDTVLVLNEKCQFSPIEGEGQYTLEQYHGLSGRDTKRFYGIWGAFPITRIDRDYDVVVRQVSVGRGPPIQVRGLQEKPHWFHGGHLPSWAVGQVCRRM